MTQPDTAVGDVAGPEGNAGPSLEERFAAHARAFEEPEEEQPEAEPEDSATDEDAEPVEATDETAEDDAEPEPEQPAIKPPASMTEAEKEAFAKLPVEQQEFVSRRIGELEKGFHAKTQAFAQEKQQIEARGLAEVQQISATYAQTLQQLLPQVPEPPSPYLQVEDPVAYADALANYQWAASQHQQVQQAYQMAADIAKQAEQEQSRREQAATVAILQDHFPEYMNPETSLKIRQELGAIGSELGFTADELQMPNGRDILALRKVAEWKADADKWRKHNSEKMAVVRAAKQAPRISKPGQPQAAGQQRQRALQADREAMRRGDSDAAKRVFSRYV